MNAAETLAALQEAGISLQVEDTSIVASPSRRLTDSLRAAIRTNKPAIIAKLSGGRFPPKPEPAEPSLAYQAASSGPDGGCKVTVVEIPATGLRYRRTFAHLQLTPPALVDVACWRQCVEDGKRFLAKWGEQAEVLGWTSGDLFGLHTVPAEPHPSFSRLSRYDAAGLYWLLQGKEVIALTADTATIRNPATGSLTTYRRFNKPALGPLGDSLDDLK